MSDGVFLETCGENIPVNIAPECQRLVQVVRLVPKSPDKSNTFKPDLPKAFQAMKPVLGKYDKIPVKGMAAATKEKPVAKGSKGKKKLGSPAASTAGIVMKNNPFPVNLPAFEDWFERYRNQINPQFPVPGQGPDGVFTNWLKDVPIGLVVVHRQCWNSHGYARGSLLNTFTLTPGEQVTIETFTWDRKKIEREHTTEDSAESERSGSLTGRVSDEVVLSARFKLTAGAEAGVDGSVSLKEMEIPADVGANGSANVGTEFETSVQTTHQQVLEATRTASERLRSLRKTRVAESVDRGSETRTTRILRNENKCHVLSYDCFEIVELFDVTIRFDSVTMVALVEFPTQQVVDEDWLLCHEHTIRRALPDASLADGFPAARLIKAARLMADRLSNPRMPPGTGTTPETPAAAPEDPIRKMLKPYADEIVAAADRLWSASTGTLEQVITRAFDLDPTNNPSERDWVDAKKACGQWWFKAQLELLDQDFFDQVDHLEAQCAQPDSDCRAPLETFLAGMAPITALLTIDGVKDFMGVPTAYDDAGLIGALQTASRAVLEVNRTQVMPVNAEQQVPELKVEDGPASPTIDDKLDGIFGLKDLMLAQVEYERLACHVRDNLSVYLAAIYGEKGFAGWSELLASYPHLAGKVDPAPLTITGNTAVFRLRDPYNAQFAADNQALIESLRAAFVADRDTARVVLPTHGLVVEARLGKCCACDDFIKEHRRLDLLAKEEEINLAKAMSRQAVAEASRLEKRLAQTPPLLDAPPATPPVIDVNVRAVAQDPI